MGAIDRGHWYRQADGSYRYIKENKTMGDCSGCLSS